MALIGIRLGSLSCSPLFRPVRAAPVFASATSRHFAFPWLLFRDCGRFSPRPFLPSSSFHPRKIPPSLFLCLPISISIPLFPSKPYNRLHGITYRCSSEPRTPFALTHARIPNECYNPRSLYDSTLSLSLSSSDFLSFNPGALGLCNFSPRGVIIRCRHRRHEKMRHGLYRRFGNTIPKKVEWNRSRWLIHRCSTARCT